MHPALLRNTLIFLFLVANNSILFAQNDALNHKLGALKAKDNLSEWLYERLDYVTAHPDNGVSFLKQTANLAWRQPKTDVEKFAWLDYFNSQGYYQLLSGQILDAINTYESALAYFEKNKGSLKDYEIIEYTLKPLSNNYTRLGDYERALYLQKKSINILKSRNQIDALSAIYGNMAISYRSMGNLSEAEKTVQEGIKIVQPNNEIHILLNNIYADILFDQNQLQKAKNLIEKNIAKQKNINDENAYWLMSSFTTAGDINLKLNNFNMAESYFNQALSILNKYFNRLRLREKANILTQLGKTKLKQNKPLIALQYFNTTLNTLRIRAHDGLVDVNKIYGENRLMEVFEQMANACLSLKKPDEAFRNIQFALITADKIRNEFATDKTKERLQADTKDIAEKGIEICYDQYLKTAEEKYLTDILNLSEQSKSRTLLDQIQRNQQLLSANKKDSLFIKKQALERAIIFNERQEIESKKTNKNTDELKFDLALINKKIKQKYNQFNLEKYSSSIAQSLNQLPNTRVIAYFFGRNSIYLLDIKNKKINHVEK